MLSLLRRHQGRVFADFLVRGSVLFLLGLGSCGGGCGKSRELADASVAQEPPVPAPDGLLAEAVVTDPNASWGRVQRGTGGALALMPMNLGGLVTSLGSLDPSLGPEIDGAAAAYGAIAGAPGTLDVSYSVAVHLLDEHRTRGTFLEGPNARYVGHEAFGMTVLAPAPPKGGAAPAALPVAAAISHGGYLVIARNEADLGRLGPYVARTLPSHPRPDAGISLEVPRSALAGPIAPYLSSLWSSFRTDMEQKDTRMREAHGGRAPDFADPRAIVEMGDAFVKDKLGILGDLERVRVGIDTTEEGLRAVASFVPVTGAGDGPASQSVRAMQVGNAEPLLEVPNAAPLAVLFRSDAEARKAGAHDASAAVAKALGDRIDADGREKLDQALADWSKGRGDFLTMAWLDAPAPSSEHGLLVRAPVTDAESASRAIHGLLGLADKPAFKGPLETFFQVHQITVSQSELAGVGKVELATITRAAPPAPAKGAPPAKLPAKGGVAWVTRPGTGAAAGGSEVDLAVAEDAMGLLRDAPAGDRDPEAAAAVKRLGSNVAVALLMRRTALEPSRAGLGLAASWGREGREARAYLETSHAVVREWIRRAGGF